MVLQDCIYTGLFLRRAGGLLKTLDDFEEILDVFKEKNPAEYCYNEFIINFYVTSLRLLLHKD